MSLQVYARPVCIRGGADPEGTLNCNSLNLGLSAILNGLQSSIWVASAIKADQHADIAMNH